MSAHFSYEFDTPAYKGKVSFPTGLYIGGKFVDGSDKTTIEYVVSYRVHNLISFYRFLLVLSIPVSIHNLA